MIRRILGFPARLLRDLFKGPGNVYWDIARFGAAFCLVLMAVAVAWNMGLRQPIDLLALGGGLGAVITALAGWIASKDWVNKRRRGRGDEE